MSLFKKKEKDIIRCDEQSYLIWKWRPYESELGKNKKENAINWGSSLRVKDGEVAVFVFKQKNNTMQEYIVGPYDEKIKTVKFPTLATVFGGSPFQAEIYFINLAHIIQVKFAVPFFDIHDPRFVDFGVPVAVRGTISFSIENFQEFIKLHRLINFDLEDFKLQIRDTVCRYVKDVIANAPAENNIHVVQIESKIGLINDVAELNIIERLKENFGVIVSGVDISAIEIDKTSADYHRLVEMTRNSTEEIQTTKTQATAKDLLDKQKIEAENYAEVLRIQRESAEYAQQMATRSANIGAYTTEKQAEVGIAGAEALGKMGTNGAGAVNLGNNSGFNMAEMMASMAVGKAVGQNIANTMNDMMGNISKPQQGDMPPPIPNNALYYIAIDGKAAGPFDIATLIKMATANQFSSDMLVWKKGMKEWVNASEVKELQKIFDDIEDIPPIP